VVKHGVTIIGYTDLASRLAKQASTLYATNLLRLTEELCKAKDGTIVVNMEDDAIRGFTVIKDGEITWPAPALKLPAPPAPKPAAAAVKAEPKKKSVAGTVVTLVLAVAVFALVGMAPSFFIGHFTVFILACFVGYMVIWNVTPALHTPLMSVTNAISSIITIGALLQVAPPPVTGRLDDVIRWIAVAGIALTSINTFGGFAVTRRMLLMFHK
jgi:H+-translocating NAD(P) transhydrogenase subunit alpha